MFFFFFKQKTAYEMRISDWSSDVCSSDLAAIRKGAKAFLMRSAGTDKSRAPHTGNTGFGDGLEPIPSAALSTIDADQLARLVALRPTRVRVALDCGFDGEYTSQYVIGELTGSERPDDVVLFARHLDSWDLDR